VLGPNLPVSSVSISFVSESLHFCLTCFDIAIKKIENINSFKKEIFFFYFLANGVTPKVTSEAIPCVRIRLKMA